MSGFRCVCLHREIFLPGLAHLLPVHHDHDRCQQRPTQEDGLCDHCRQDEGCPCCAPAVRGAPAGGCRWYGSNRRRLPIGESVVA